MRIFFAIVAMAGVGVAIYQLINGNWASALAFLLCSGVVVSYYLFGFNLGTDTPWRGLTAAIASALSIYATFTGSSAFSAERIQAHVEALSAFTSIELSCRIRSAELSALQQEGIKACSLQDYSAMADTMAELQKHQLGPALSIIDGVHSASKKPNADWCAEVYRATKTLCPTAFSSLSASSVISLESQQ